MDETDIPETDPTRAALRIQSDYECGRHSERTVSVPLPDATADVGEWLRDAAFDEGGDGHPCGRTEGSIYTATVLSAPGRPELVGKEEETG